ncbi:NAD(P)/FAD-dependent oxidoreductase [Protaetiibacter mangrovi]|uniref:NAD(P)/FAD-dependent oxidoreductase n=1 Tax=Protaetiibacter mangrovi TaxID=2970926 RepID=A0ABT1ZHD5_9MICO|nr:NAD(P)/FAD-dependent oxidoreductase [Protaetiibacter mangrovi]MCS0500132.1 NAD(P)/FAD-dependent oxidoreductase [Protaetiibacter mangrovi]
MSDAELLVVGGGPVGLATAIEARLVGIDALVVEPREGVIDKACGEGVMPGAGAVFGRLGIAPRAVPISGIDYRDDRRSVQHRFARGPGFGVRRTELHRALLERAEQLGVRRRAARAEEVRSGEDGVVVRTSDGRTLRADWAVGADGLHSPVARALDLAVPEPARGRRYGQRRHYRIQAWTDLVEVHWVADGEFYVTPLADGLVGVALLARRGIRFDDALARAPRLRERLDGATPASGLRGAGPFRQRTRARTRGRTLLVGDASGYVDALTAEGLRIGFAQAGLAVQAIRAQDAARYEREWLATTREFRVMTERLVRVASSPLRGLVVPTAARFPGLYARAVERIAR